MNILIYIAEMDSTQWHAFLTSCLDILRNGDSKFDGIKAINEFLSLITLKLVENRIRKKKENNEEYNDEKIRIGEDCKMTWLFENYCKPEHLKDSKKANELYDLLYNVGRVWSIKQKLDDNLNVLEEKKTRNNKDDCVFVRFNQHTDKLTSITNNITDSKNITSFDSTHAWDIQKLVAKIHTTIGNLDMSKLNYDAFGEAYEKMMTDELGNSSKRYGQHFTRRDLIDLIIKELNIKSQDKCYDPACGTGGFLLGFAKAFKKDKEFVKKNIYGQEFLPDVHKTMCFNMLAFGIDGCLQNISKGDSIDVNYHNKVAGKFDVVGANPPFGMSINCDINDYPIKVKNSVALFLQHIYFSLKKGGRAGIVIDRGILNNGTDKQNSWEKKLRKFLLENTSINKIINLPTGIFKHTNFATSVIFFTKGEQTKSIKYIEGYFKDEDKGKGDKRLYLKEEKILNINDIKNKNYSLKWDDYFGVEKQEQKEGWIELGDICDLERGKIITIKDIVKGEYPVIGGGQKPMGYHDKFNRDENTILVSGSGSYAGLLSKYKNKVWASDCFSIQSKNTELFINEYIWYHLKINQNKLYKLQHGQGQPHVNANDLKDFLIPNLSLQHQQEIVELLDELYKGKKITTENADGEEETIIKKYSIDNTIEYLKDYPIFNLLIQKKYDQFVGIIELQENLKILFKEKEFIKEKKLLQIKGIFNSMCIESNAVEMKLGDICEITSGKAVNVSERVGTKFPYYASNGNIGFVDNFTHDGEIVICAQDGTIGATHYYNGKIWASNHVWILKNDKTNVVKIKYLYLFMKHFINYKLYISGNAIPKLTKYNIERLNIFVPSVKIQDEIVKKIEQLEFETSHYYIYSKAIQTELDNISQIIKNICMMNDLKQIDEENNENEDSDNEDNSSLKSTESSKSSGLKKKVSRTKKQVETEYDSDLDNDSKTSKTKKTKSAKSSKIANDEPKEKKNKSTKSTKLEK